MIFFIGLGIGERGISLEGIARANECGVLYLEGYTSFLPPVDELERQIGKKIIPLSRREIEETGVLFDEAKSKKVGLLVGGDPMCATTHQELFMRAKKEGIAAVVVHSSSIFSAVGACGLQLYKFGRTASVPYPEKNFFPESPYVALRGNLSAGLHTLLLLDVKSEEGRYMSANEGMQVLLQIEEKRREGIFTERTGVVVLARLGWEGQKIAFGSVSSLLKRDFGEPPHAIVVPGKLHFVEEEALNLWNDNSFGGMP